MIYLDHNATTPLDARVLEAMLPWLHMAGNPSSVHRAGRDARQAIDRAREQVAALVGARPEQVVFTSGGTEANNAALYGLAAGRSGGVIAISAVEHASLIGPAQRLAAEGWRLESIAVDVQGRVGMDALAAVLDHRPALVSVMWANNETGVIQPVAELAAQVRESGCMFHTDAVQAAGKLEIDFAASGAHLMSLSAHKLYGPKGVGALVIDKRLEPAPLLVGGGQEKGRRAGTENVAGIVGFGAAAELAVTEMPERAARQHELRQRLEQGLAGIEGVTLFGREAERLPNTVQFALAGMDGETLVMQLDRAGIAVSSGSACASGSTEPSHVLLAMGVAPEVARGAVRVSIGKDTTAADIDACITAVAGQVEWLQRTAGAAAW